MKPYIPRRAALTIREPSKDALLSIVRRVSDETSVPSHILLGPSTTQRALAARRQAVRAIIDAFPGISRTTLETLFARNLDPILGPAIPSMENWKQSPLKVYHDFLSSLPPRRREKLLARRKDAQTVYDRRSAITRIMAECSNISVRHIAEVMAIPYDTVRSIVYGKIKRGQSGPMPALLESIDTPRTMCKDPTRLDKSL